MRERQKGKSHVSARNEFAVCPCDAAITCSFKKVRRVYRWPSLWTVFLFICRFQRPSAVPLINLPWKKNTLFQASAGCTGISEQSMRGASVKEAAAAAAGPSDVGEGENLSMNPTIYPVQRCREQRESSTFPLQQPSIALGPFPDNTASWLQLLQDG